MGLRIEVTVLLALARACHPGPTIAVVLISTALAWRLGWSGGGLLLVALAVLLGQLSIGWSNDAHDAGVDAAARRRAKPTVTGDVSASTLFGCAVTALALSSVASWVAAGWLAGSLHVVAVLAGWTYNYWLSRTLLSWLPYALAFGLLPAFLAMGIGIAVSWWLIAVFAIVGVSAHLANALRDASLDADIGVGNIAWRLGDMRTRMIALILLAAGVAIAVALTRNAIAGVILLITYALTAVLVLLRRGSIFAEILSAAMALAVVVLVWGF